jgi:glutathione S-transferase
MPNLPILYSFRRCPYAMRARLALLASEATVILREVKLPAKPAPMLSASPKGTVPVLVLADDVTADGSVIDESLSIMQWALAQNDPQRWLDHADFALIEQNDGAFKYHLDRYKYADRYAVNPAEHRAAALAMLTQMDGRLAKTAYLCGDAMGLTDAAIFPFIRQFAQTDRPWFDAQSLPHIQAWLEGLCGSSLFAKAMVRHKPWDSTAEPTLFP